MVFLGTFPFLFGSYNKAKMYFKNTHKILEEKYFRCYTSLTSKSQADYFSEFQLSGYGTPVFQDADLILSWQFRPRFQFLMNKNQGGLTMEKHICNQIRCVIVNDKLQ